MLATIRWCIEMGKRVLDFLRAHPDPDPGYNAAASLLQERLDRAEVLGRQQSDGYVQVRNATARKMELRRTLTERPLYHLAHVARVAAGEVPDFERKFALARVRGASTYLAFRTVARSIATEAVAQKELLVKHGLAASMLDELVRGLDEFDVVIAQGDAGRQMHVGATAELRQVARDVVTAVKVIDGYNRSRFAQDRDTFAKWKSASDMFTKHPPLVPPATGAIQPAA